MTELKEFRRVADEKLFDLVVDERMVARIRQACCTAPLRRGARPGLLQCTAAACLMVMLISGAILAGRLLPQMAAVHQGQAQGAGDAQAGGPTAVTLSSTGKSSLMEDGTMLEYGVESVGEYSEGYAAARATNGLYGYVNAAGHWVTRALYDMAGPVQDGIAQVTLEGEAQTIHLPPLD